MGYQNRNTTESFDLELTRLLQNCRDTQSIEDLLETVQKPLFDGLGIEAISLALVDETPIFVTSIKPITPTFKEQIVEHKIRCLPTVSSMTESNKATNELQQVGVVFDPNPLGSSVRIAWTGALENRGRLVAVVTFYHDEVAPMSDKQINILRDIRASMTDALIKFGRTQHYTTDDKLVDRQNDIILIKIFDDSRTSLLANSNTLDWVQAMLIRRLNFEGVQTLTFDPNTLALVTSSLSDRERIIWADRITGLENTINQDLNLEFRLKAQFTNQIGDVSRGSSVKILTPICPAPVSGIRVSEAI